MASPQPGIPPRLRKGPSPRWWALATLLISLGAGGQPAANQEQLERERAEVRATLVKLQAAIANDEAQLESETVALRTVEQALAETRRQLATSEARLRSQQQRLEALEAEATERSAQLATARSELGTAIGQAYRRGQNPELKALLSLSDPGDGARQLRYFQVIQQSMGEKTARLVSRLAGLATKRAEVRASRAALSAERQTLAQARQRYEQQQSQRQAAMMTLNRRLQEQRQTGADLAADEARLNRLIAELEALLADLPAPGGGPGLDSKRGDLPLPVAGRVLRGPGQTKPAGLHRLGMLLEANAGDPVYAVSYGRVAYADWLRGYGLLTIVDHGDGYLTLYAFNESLFREVGDWVDAGDLIAAAGASGGRNNSGLYFELRKAGQPVDPRPWLRNR